MMVKDLHRVANRDYVLIYDTYNLDQAAYGPHLMLDISGCDVSKLNSLEFCQKFLSELPGQIGMTKIYGPVVMRYNDENDPLESGVTGLVVIAQSHISIHTYPEKNYAFIDVFSCRYFDHKMVTEKIIELFDVKNTDAYICKRGVGF